ncbi:hypothetical protein ACEPAG_5636 [Sanghuangporus baumii]
MIASKSLFVAFTAVAAVAAYVVPRTQPPNGWWTEGLEDYNSYHTRYLALGCQNQHGKPFFDSCCHPLKANETLETARPPECVPSWSSAVSACAAEPTSTVTTPDDDTSASVTGSASASPAASSATDVSVTTSASVVATPSPVSNVATDSNNGDDADGEDEEDGQDGDEEFCDEDDDDDTSSSVVPTSTAASEPTSAPAPSSTPAQSDGDDDEGDDEDEDCDEDGEDEDTTSSAVPSSTSVPGTTESAAPESTSEPVVNPAPAPSSSEVASSTSDFVSPTSEVASSTSEAPTPTSSSPTFSPESTRKHSSSKSSSAAESTPTSDSSSQVFTDGVATFFFQNNNPGACGDVHSDDDLIAAIDSARYGNTGEKSELCGKQVKITNTKNNKEVTVTIADACPTCENGDSIDLSAGAFDKIADRSEGVVPISWSFV